MNKLSRNQRDKSFEWELVFIGKPDPDYLVNMVFKEMIQEIIGGGDNEDRSSI